MRELGDADAQSCGVVVEVDAVQGQPQQQTDEDDPDDVAGDGVAAACDDQVDQSQGEEEPQDHVVEELLRGDGHEDEAVRHAVLQQGVVGDDPAADSAGREDVAHGEAAEGDREDLVEAQVDVEHAQDVAEQVRVAEERHDLQKDGHDEQHIAGVGDVFQSRLRVDDTWQQEVQRRHDDGEDDDVPERLLDAVSPTVGGRSRPASDSTTGGLSPGRGHPCPPAGSSARARSGLVSAPAPALAGDRRGRVAEHAALDLLAAEPGEGDRRRHAGEGIRGRASPSAAPVKSRTRRRRA